MESTKDDLYGFMHICTINAWKSVVEDQLRQIVESGLYDKLTTLYCGVVGSENVDFLSKLSKIKILYIDPDVTNFEFLTLEGLQAFCKKPEHHDSYVFYIHSKGITKHAKNKPISEIYSCIAQDWRKYMDHFIIERHEECVKQMNDGADVVGVNWRGIGTPIFKKYNNHFNGNFWWAKSAYISSLVAVREGEKGRCNAEYWIAKGSGVSSSLFETMLNHYKDRCPRDVYENKIELCKWNFDNGRCQKIK